LLTKKYLKDQALGHKELKLTVIGDVSCDIHGAIEITPKATRPDNPTVTYFPENDNYEDGTLGKGITVMSVDNLPCEFPRDSSSNFSNLLKDFIKGITAADFRKTFDNLELPEPVKKALVLHRGRFTPAYRYMEEFLK
jgi:alpha-aminoadipic semialdehyde synthase